jgi:electron transfer flavoprotein beta subunit
MGKMLNLIVCIKQVPMVTELPWDEKTGTLRRDLAPGMMNPACKHALEAALQIKEKQTARITVVTMGPQASAEVLREALALGADRAILICDKLFAGSDTFATSYVLAQAIKKDCPDYDLIISGCYTSDSETAQVGPQLAEELNLPAAAYIESMEIYGRTLRVQRFADNFRETLEMELPALITVGMTNYWPRYTGLGGLEQACGEDKITVYDAPALGINPLTMEASGSCTKVRRVFLRKMQKENVFLQGAAAIITNELLQKYEDKISSVIGKDIKREETENE